MYDQDKCPVCNSCDLEYITHKEQREAYGTICYETICDGYECQDCGYKEKY